MRRKLNNCDARANIRYIFYYTYTHNKSLQIKIKQNDVFGRILKTIFAVRYPYFGENVHPDLKFIHRCERSILHSPIRWSLGPTRDERTKAIERKIETISSVPYNVYFVKNGHPRKKTLLPKDYDNLKCVVRIKSERTEDGVDVINIWDENGKNVNNVSWSADDLIVLKSHEHLFNSTCISLSGGGCMNFNGVFHKFQPRNIRPRSLSFRYRITQTQPMRGFFNVFLSSASRPYKNVDVFYLGTPLSVLDISCLISTTNESSSDVEMWLPSGNRVKLFPTAVFGDIYDDGYRDCDKSKWRKIEIDFKWDSSDIMPPKCSFRHDGTFIQTGHSMIGRPLRQKFNFDICSKSQWEETTDRNKIGYNYLYLFHWVERNDADGSPSVDVTDLWIE